jgi:hypothetical protein
MDQATSGAAEATYVPPKAATTPPAPPPVEPPTPPPAATSAPVPTTGEPVSPRSEQLPATPGEVKALNAAITTRLKITDRGDKLAWISGMVGRDVESSKDLTSAECGRLIEAAKNGVMPREPGADD